MSGILTLGITTELTVIKADALKSFKDLDFIRNYVEKEFNSTKLYNITENEDRIIWKLDDSILREELCDFAIEFYNYYPGEQEDDTIKQNTIEVLNKHLEPSELFKHFKLDDDNDNYPYMRYYDHDEYIANNEDEYDAPTCFLEFVMFGKFLETDFFPLFHKLLREKFCKYKLASVLMLNGCW